MVAELAKQDSTVSGLSIPGDYTAMLGTYRYLQVRPDLVLIL
jgi:hypothetical protein